ncbi:MAG: DUF4198 domain-containing protein, partial [Peptococcaceae bacterium]|nr:DUF4198 domain-containing protein [Peptococcaceae bacterium]
RAVTVADPAGNTGPARLDQEEGGQAAVVFEAGREGIYTVTVESSAGTARVMVPVGHHVSGRGRAAGKGLEMLPLEYREFHHNETAEIQVLLDGSPLPGALVWARSHLHGGPLPYSHRVESGDRGIFRFTFTEKGHWLFVVEHGGKFATLLVPGVH